MNVKLRITVGDDSKEYGCSLANLLEKRGYNVFTHCRNESVLLKAIRDEMPDFVILNNDSPEINAVAFIGKCSCLEHKPFFIVASEHRDEFVEHRIRSIKNAVYIPKPFDIEAMLKVIGIVTAMEDAYSDPLQACYPEALVNDIIYYLDIPVNFKGYRYVRSAILLCYEDSEMLYGITKVLYHEIAKEFKTSAISVERNIRHAISTAWEKGYFEITQKLLYTNSNFVSHKPSNKEFISLVCNKLRTIYKCDENDY